MQWYCMAKITWRLGSSFDFIVVGRLLSRWEGPSNYHSPPTSPKTTDSTSVCLTLFSSSHSLILHCSLAHSMKHVFVCQESVKIHIRSRWKVQLVLPHRPGSFSFFWPGIMSPQGKRHWTQCCLLKLQLSQNDSPLCYTHKKTQFNPSQGSWAKKEESIGPRCSCNFWQICKC
jgi:hypothetical protein